MKPCKICNKPQSGGYIICAECAVEVNRMQAEIQQFREAAAEYGIDAQTMLTLARSQIATAKENAELREAQRWIPVKERLPEAYIQVLVHRVHSYCDNDGYDDVKITARTGVINGNVADWMETGSAYIVTHWMPLPGPPKEG